MGLTARQKRIAEIVRVGGPITGQHIADKLSVTRAALRSDLAILVMSGIIDARPKVGYFFTGKSTLGLLTEEISDILVSDIQSTPVVIKNTQSAYEAIISMFVEDVGSVYVVDERNLLVGVVSRKDLLKLATNSNGDMKTIPVVMAMTPLAKMIMVSPDTTVAGAARKVIDNQIDSLPVVKCVDEKTKDYEVVGRITKTNFTRLFVEIAEGKEVGHHK
ncbi:MAG: helix-turn-helix transcriptional regulator [Acidaminococcaceae bacterium]|jgi:CBS domain-containing protein|nr:helix-turn-helix transcriptional regulator [Acidaminococcaceae bacterium]MBO5637007.1 helix-turn-helix transcriptional regulator [Acidaminococcaceae bacterium]MBP3812682.1 helix-turn-helix transcriptional regulator [Acidaminococcaceae bacterium]MBR1662110.1 helix-turn-helix transcriptional regulator [Acidaminococcaceae bacterium]HAT98549.1 transcriptional repressor CcpN [Acidaminococcaceae bacterium]